MKTINEIFIEKAKRIHCNKYDYSKVEYINNHTKVCIICPIHGEFWQRPQDHLKGCGCKYCTTNKFDTNKFIQKAKNIHGDKYDYSKVKYVNAKEKVCIICKTHGEFWQKPQYHLQGNGCPKCGKENSTSLKKISINSFLERANKVHDNKYDYTLIKQINSSREKVDIICKLHGIFKQEVESHLRGCGCPKCSNYSHIENDIRKLLKENNIDFEEQKKFEWLGKQKLDFYLPYYNIAIECQGEQHFKPIAFYNGQEGFERRKKLDKIKKDKCEKNNVILLYYSDLKNIPIDVIGNKEKLLEKIM